MNLKIVFRKGDKLGPNAFALPDGTIIFTDEIITEAVAAIRKKIGPVAAFRKCTVVPRLPKTRSGKVLRATMRKIADGEDFSIPATIDDPAILDEITDVLQSIGYAKEK